MVDGALKIGGRFDTKAFYLGFRQLNAIALLKPAQLLQRFSLFQWRYRQACDGPEDVVTEGVQTNVLVKGMVQ